MDDSIRVTVAVNLPTSLLEIIDSHGTGTDF